MKICNQCKESKELDQFWKCNGTPDGLQYKCIACSKKRWENVVNRERKSTPDDVRRYLFSSAKSRAREKGIAFTITLEDIVIPENCPVLKVKMTSARGARHENSYTLDRVDNSKGYEPGNVRVISWRANYVKATLSLEEIERLYLYSKGQI